MPTCCNCGANRKMLMQKSNRGYCKVCYVPPPPRLPKYAVMKADGRQDVPVEWRHLKSEALAEVKRRNKIVVEMTGERGLPLYYLGIRGSTA